MDHAGGNFPLNHVGMALFALRQGRKARPLGSLGILMTGRTLQLQRRMLPVVERPFFIRPLQRQGKTGKT